MAGFACKAKPLNFRNWAREQSQGSHHENVRYIAFKGISRQSQNQPSWADRKLCRDAHEQTGGYHSRCAESGWSANDPCVDGSPLARVSLNLA